jgi:arylsulfatase A-like enzyme
LRFCGVPPNLWAMQRTRVTRSLFTSLGCFFLCGSVWGAGTPSRVVLVVWDGMRPDFVTAETTPTLFKLAQVGVTFKRHHPVFPSETEVNGTALATGVYPAQSGLIGNKEFRPEVDAATLFHSESLEVVRMEDRLTGGHYLGFPTVAELLHEQGFRTVIAGSKGVALLHDRAARDGNAPGVDVFEGRALPEALTGRLAAQLGEFPPVKKNGARADDWTTAALVGPLWEKEVPRFSVLWLGLPDVAQHPAGPGSPAALAAIKHSDEKLAQVLAALEQRQLRAETDIIVVSDHGFSTIGQRIDVAQELNDHGFHAFRTFPDSRPHKNDIIVVNNGGCVFLYVTGHVPSQIEKVTHFLQTQPFSGVIFTRQPVEGTFRLKEVCLDTPKAPDIIVSLHWTGDKSSNGTPGLLYSDYSEYGPGQGMHGSLSPFDMHNTGIAAGPDFRHGFTDNLPTGNIDIAPTVLWLLGIQPKQKLSGRVLSEALKGAPAAAPVVSRHQQEASYRGEQFVWHQYLSYCEVSGVRYFDEGNGQQAARDGVATVRDAGSQPPEPSTIAR